VSRRLLLAAAFALPALALLVLARDAAAHTPEPADWRVYLREPPLAWQAGAWLDVAGQPNHLAWRGLHAAMLAAGVDFAHGVFVCVALAFACGLAAVPLRVMTPALGLLLGGLLFSPAYGADWALLERTRVFVPVLLALMALRLLARPLTARRVVSAGVLAVLAVFTHETGALLWAALLPALWSAARAAGWRRLPVMGVWCLLANVALAVCYDESARAFPGLLASLWRAPWATTLLLVKLSAAAVPDLLPGSDADAVIAGGGLIGLALLGVLSLRRAGVETRQAATWWTSLLLLGLAQVLALAHVHAPQSVTDTVLREVAWGTWLLPAGTVGLWLALRPGLAARALPMAAAALGVLVVQDWHRGAAWLEAESRLLRQSEALMVFADLGGQELPPQPRPPVLEAAARQALRARGLLRRSAPVAGRGLDEFSRVEDAPAGTVVQASRTTAAGIADRAAGGADLVLLRRGRERELGALCKVAAPNQLEPGRHVPWQADLGDLEPFADGEWLRADAFDLATRTLRPLQGRFRCHDGRFEPVEDSQ